MPKPKKLTDDDVRIIRLLYTPPEQRMSLYKIAKKFGVSHETIRRVVSWESYIRVRP